jgi:plastocyanin
LKTFSNTPQLIVLILVLVLSLSMILPACTSSSTPPATSYSSSAAPSSAAGPTTISLVAQNMAFDKKTITVPAGAQITINFDNKDSGIPHNFAVYNDQSASQVIFKGDIIRGPDTKTYSFTAPTTPGTYFFRCDAHPTTMTGQFTVQ